MLWRLTLALTIAGWLAGTGCVDGADRGPAVERWRIAEIVFHSQREYSNPTRDVRLDVTFTQGGRRIARPAFWDGGDVWKVRFAPPDAGTWQYGTECSDRQNARLHGRSGRLRCVPYRGDNPLYAHGFLRVSDDRRRLVHADGTAFFWLGDTHWMGPDNESVSACNHPVHKDKPCPHGGAFQHVVHDRKAKGFSVYQMYPHVQAGYYWSGEYAGLDPARFRDVFDPMMDHLAENGFVVALGLGHWAAPKAMKAEDLKLFARYVVARYGAHPVVWITAQEADMNDQVGGVWKAVAEEIRRADGYPHPLSYHQRVGVTTTWWAQPWHDWACAQGGHRNSGLRSQSDYRRFWDHKPTKPWLEGESMYEGMTACGGPHATAEVRHAAWKSILCGSFGYTYGGSGIWLFGGDAEGVKRNQWIDHPWYDGMDLPGSTQMGHLKRFFLGMNDWSRLTPRWAGKAWGQWAHPEESVIATVGREVFIVYFYGAGVATGTLKGLDPSTTYIARWFDPRLGAYKAIADGIRSSDGAWRVPERPDRQDWVLILEANRQAESQSASLRPEGATGWVGPADPPIPTV